MTVHVVVCCDPADRGSELWTHGVYTSIETARRVCQRLTNETYWTVRVDSLRVKPAGRQPKAGTKP